MFLSYILTLPGTAFTDISDVVKGVFGDTKLLIILILSIELGLYVIGRILGFFGGGGGGGARKEKWVAPRIMGEDREEWFYGEENA